MQRDQEAMIEITEGLYQVSNDFLEELGAFLHLVLRPSQLDDVTFLCRVGEIDNDLEVDEITLWWIKLQMDQNKFTVMNGRDKAR